MIGIGLQLARRYISKEGDCRMPGERAAHCANRDSSAAQLRDAVFVLADDNAAPCDGCRDYSMGMYV